MELKIKDVASYLPWKYTERYESEMYILVDIDETDPKYNIALSKSSSHYGKILKIQEVQHPTAFLRYWVQTEFLNDENISFTENFRATTIEYEDTFRKFLQYGCDDRDLVNIGSTKCMKRVIYKQRNCEITTDKNHYPLYVIEFEMENDK